MIYLLLNLKSSAIPIKFKNLKSNILKKLFRVSINPDSYYLNNDTSYVLLDMVDAQ